METKKYEIGIWTPWGKVLCIGCHGRTFKGVNFNFETNQREDVVLTDEEFEMESRPRKLKYNYLPTTCTECGKEIQMDYTLARENNLVNSLKDLEIDACMAQMGGMNSACEIAKKDGKGCYYVVYDCNGDEDYSISSFDEEEEFIEGTVNDFLNVDELIAYIVELKDVKRIEKTEEGK